MNQGLGDTDGAYDPTQSFSSSQSASVDPLGEQAPLAKVSIVEGPDSQTVQELETLRTRLRAAAIVILFGFGIYLVRSYFDNRPLQGFHTLVVFTLTCCIGVLASRLVLTRSHLRWLELVIFGVPVLFFVPYHYFCVLQQHDANDPVGIVAIFKNVASYWFCLLVIYGLYIPSNWKRTTIVVAPMVLLPVATGVLAAIKYPLVGEHLNARELTDTFMVLCVGALCAAYGAEVIRSLRKEASDARQFGQYRLLDPIGQGGMGEVYKAEHQLLKRPCAIKLIRPEHAGNPQALARFEREVRSTAKLTHWNTIDIYDYGRTNDGTFYYVMEYLPGMNLRDVINAGGPMPAARVIHILKQICAALSEAHKNALIHRDINTGNVFITSRGGVEDVAKLLDFGLVKVVGPGAEDTNLTAMGTFSGTPKYMSPEQASSDAKPDLRSDIYSLGAVAYVMLTAYPPFDGPSPMHIIIAHARDPVPPMHQYCVGIPAELEEIVMRCLAKNPADRFESADALYEALQQCPLDDAWTQSDAAQWWREARASGIQNKGKSDSMTRMAQTAELHTKTVSDAD